MALKKLAKDTIHTSTLPHSEIVILNNLIKILPNETIEIIYKHKGKFFKSIDIVNDVLVGITNKRIFMIDCGKLTSTPLEDIRYIKHIPSRFGWDRLILISYTGGMDLYTIHSTKSTKYFVMYLKYKINNLDRFTIREIEPPQSSVSVVEQPEPNNYGIDEFTKSFTLSKALEHITEKELKQTDPNIDKLTEFVEPPLDLFD